MDRRLRPFAWAGLGLVAGAGLAWMVLAPGDLSYLVGPFTLIVPAVFVGLAKGPQLEAWYARRRVSVWFATLALAIAGATWGLLDPGDRSFVVGSVMTLPALFATALLDRDSGPDTRSDADLGTGIYGPPPL
jgi:hypothetical protein